MGKRRRIFSEPKYEINLETKDKVLIKQERKSPLGQLLTRMASAVFIVLAVIFLGGLVFNWFSALFYPTHVYLTTSHNNNESLSLDNLKAINIYMDGRKKPMSTKTTPNGLSFRYSKKGQHIIGIENTASRYDSLSFAREHALLDSLGLFNQKRVSQKSLDNFVFHHILSDQDLEHTRFLSFVTRLPHTSLDHIFLSYDKQSSIVIADVTSGKNIQQGSPLSQDFQGSLMKNLLKFSPHVETFSSEKSNIDIPTFNSLNWYSESFRTHRFQYADKMNKRLTSSIFILPYIYKNQTGQALANLILAFADIGDITFEPIEIRNIPLGEPETVAANAGVFSIVQAYLSLYDSFIYSGSLDASMINAFIQICNDTPNADLIARLGNKLMRIPPTPKTNSIVYTLDEFFAKIENMDCLALYEELSNFWVNDPYQLRAITDFNTQEREVVRAIIKWSLALKENEHDCAEDDWPSAEQRRSFFTTIKNVIDTTSSLSWLQGDALYGVLIIEINELER